MRELERILREAIDRFFTEESLSWIPREEQSRFACYLTGYLHVATKINLDNLARAQDKIRELQAYINTLEQED